MGLNCAAKKNRISGTESSDELTVSRSTTTLDVVTRDLESQNSVSADAAPSHSIWWKIGIDLPLLLIIATLLALFELGLIPSHKGGFYCNDPALSFEFTGDTVTSSLLMIGVILFPFVTVYSSELFLTDVSPFASRSLNALKTAAVLYKIYIYGLFFNLGIVEMMKGLMGSPRPTFFDICEPDAALTCNGSEFVTDFKCTSKRFSKWFQSDSYHSFPSGHTSLSVLCGLYITWYLQRRLFSWRSRSIVLVPVLQLAALTFAATSSLTRITDHRHHWWDVIVGAVIGLATTCYVVILTRAYTAKLSASSRSADDKVSLGTVV